MLLLLLLWSQQLYGCINELWLLDNHDNDCILTFVAVNALTIKVQQLESQLKMAENIASNLMDNSANADLGDAPATDDQEYQEEDVDDDNETIEEEPDMFSSGGDDLFSESDEQTDTEDNITGKKGKRLSIASDNYKLLLYLL